MLNPFSGGLVWAAAGVALAASAISFPSFAQSQSQSADEADASAARHLDAIVVTAGRREQQISDVQASIEVIEREEIESYSGASVTEVLRQSVGVDARTSGANSTVTIRGQVPNAGTSVLILFDGLPRTGKFGVPNLNNFGIEDVERIEVIRGPMSALYGANASGGVINVITKPAGEGPPLSVRGTLGTVASGEGDGRDTGNVGATGNFVTGVVGHRVSVDYRRAEAFQFDDTANEDDLSSLEHLALTYKGVAEIGDAGELGWTLEGFFQDDRSDGFAVSRVPGVPGTPFERFEEEDRYYGALTYDADIGPGVLTVEAAHGFSDASAKRSLAGEDEDTDFTQTISQGRYFFEAGDHNLLFGAGAQRDEVDVSILSEENAETNLFGFAQDEWNLTEHIRLIVGLRVDDFDSFGTEVTPRVTVGSRGDGFTWRLGYGQAFRAPVVVERFSRFTRGRFLIVGNEDLKPEEADTFEAAVGWRGRKGNVELVYHYTKIDNLIQAVPNGAVENGLTVFEYQNIAEARIAGIELSGFYDIGAGFAVDASYEYLDAEDEETGDRLTGRARHTVKAALTYTEDRWRVTLRGRHIDDFFGTDPDDRARPAFDSAYTVADVNLRYAVTDKAAISFGVDNLFDEQVPDNWSTNGTIEDPPGRFVYVSLRYAL
ncbi:MAG: TonB-dependent receptor [Minwuiales bacterium]|nr:TonB-dependent receptor [Minwuiales bacterium]